jgi:hypothetical protein
VDRSPAHDREDGPQRLQRVDRAGERVGAVRHHIGEPARLQRASPPSCVPAAV